AEFGLGDHLLVCPITQPGAEGRWMYLPRGDWFYYWTDAPTAGGSEVWAAADLSRIPLFVKAGAVVPMQPVLQYVGEKAIEELTLHVYYKNGTAESVHYDDGGEGYAYQDDQRTVRRFTVAGSETELRLTQTTEGDYAPSYATYRVVLHGLPGAAGTVSVDGAATPVTEATLETGLMLPSVVVPVSFGEVRVSVGPPAAASAAKG
ncbi:MAG: DUF5110 domain-containing protein, partial [Hymenobacter sp.]|nr:DUF5110 domain-containing protein [Hymenobacter sp.]